MRRIAIRRLVETLFVLLVVLGGLPLAYAQNTPRPDVPAVIKAPPGLEVVLVAHASGSQIYTCQAGADGKPAWTLKAPEADLADGAGNVIGSHFAGPSWKLNDGSQVRGKAAAHADSPEPNSIQWLLIDVVGNSGKGQLANMTTIHRINTHGGKAPSAGCDASHPGSETKSSYTADYYFYAPGK